MKILLATANFPPEISSAASYAVEFARQLSDRHSITVAAYTDSSKGLQGTKLISVTKKLPLLFRLVKFFFVIQKPAKDSDIIYAQNAMAAGFPAAVAASIKNVPLVVRFMGDEAWERARQHRLTTKSLEEFLGNSGGNLKIRLMKLIQGWVLRKADAIVTPSKYIGDTIIKAYKLKPEKVFVNYNAAETPIILPFEAEVNRHQIAISLAGKQDDIRSAYEALEIVRKKFTDATLVVAGGNISKAEAWYRIKSSLVCIINSSYETLPLRAVEIFSADTPIIATDINGNNEAIFDEETGLLVKPRDVPGLAGAIEKLFENQPLREKLVLNASKLLKERFSWQTHFTNLEEIFNAVLSRAN